MVFIKQITTMTMTQLLKYTTSMKNLSNIMLSERSQIQKWFHVYKDQTKFNFKVRSQKSGYLWKRGRKKDGSSNCQRSKGCCWFAANFVFVDLPGDYSDAHLWSLFELYIYVLCKWSEWVLHFTVKGLKNKKGQVKGKE